MPHTKKAPKKTETVEEIAPVKLKGAFDIDATEAFAGEKVEETDIFGATTDDAEELPEEPELDAEEVNPFGDKWEE